MKDNARWLASFHKIDPRTIITKVKYNLRDAAVFAVNGDALRARTMMELINKNIRRRADWVPPVGL